VSESKRKPAIVSLKLERSEDADSTVIARRECSEELALSAVEGCQSVLTYSIIILFRCLLLPQCDLLQIASEAALSRIDSVVL